MFIKRDFNRTEHDDYVLNVQSHLDLNTQKEAVPIYGSDQKDAEGNLINKTKVCIGWKIQYKFE